MKTWSETKRILKLKFATLTDNDLLLCDGKHEDVLNKIQIKLGKTKEEIHRIIAEL